MQARRLSSCFAGGTHSRLGGASSRTPRVVQIVSNVGSTRHLGWGLEMHAPCGTFDKEGTSGACHV